MSGLPFLQKPFTATALRDAIQVALGPKVCDGFHEHRQSRQRGCPPNCGSLARSHIVSAIIPLPMIHTSRNSPAVRLERLQVFSRPTESGVVQWVCNGE